MTKVALAKLDNQYDVFEKFANKKVANREESKKDSYRKARKNKSVSKFIAWEGEE